MGEVGRICDSKLTDEEFIQAVCPLVRSQLVDLLNRLTVIRDECRNELFTAITKFRETGVPSEPEWFQKCKSATNIRNKHIMIVNRKLSLMNDSHSKKQAVVGKFLQQTGDYLEEEERNNAEWDKHWAEVDNER